MAFRLPAYEVHNKLLDLSPLNSALEGYQQQMNQNAMFGLQQRRLGMDEGRYNAEQQKLAREIERARVLEPLEDREKQARIAQIMAAAEAQRAHAGYYSAGARNLDSKARGASQQQTQSDDTLAGYGLDDEGNIIPPASAKPAGMAATPAPSAFPNVTPADAVSGRSLMQDRQPNFNGLMRLGGPRPEAETTTLPVGPDRGQRWREMGGGVQVAQAGSDARNPHYSPQVGENWGGGGVPPPSLMDQAKARTFGPLGVTTLDVPGIVTTPRGSPSQMATREMQGQRAYDAATPEQQQRLQKMRQEQSFWSYTYGRQPRAGYYYGSDGREMPLTDKNFKGDRENQSVALMNWNKIESAGDVLLGKRTGRVDDKGEPIRDGSGPFLATRAVAGQLNMGEIGQAYADMKQGALGIAYALSGKTVAVAEMKNFIEAYGPQPLDSPERIAAKMQRMKGFYQALLTSSRGGENYETAFARAMAVTGMKNPDGTSPGAPAAASAAQPQQQPPRSANPGQDRLKNKYGLE